MASASTSFFVPAGIKLSQFQLRLLDHLAKFRAKKHGICFASKTLADALGVAVRTVQAGLKKLRELGILIREWDYELKTRRRLFLGSETPPMNAQPCAQSTHDGAFTDGSPHIESLESLRERVVVVVNSNAIPPDDDDRRRPSDSSDEDTPKAKATPEQVEALKARAEGLFGASPGVRSWVASVARAFSFRATMAALGKAEAKVKAGKTVKAEFVEVVAKGILAEGVIPVEAVAAPRPKAPPPRPEDTYRPRPDLETNIAAFRAMLEDPSLNAEYRRHLQGQLDEAIASRQP